MLRHFTVILLTILTALSAAAQGRLSFTSTSAAPVQVSPEASTGLQAVYVLESTAGVKAVYQANTSSVVWQKYSTLGGGFAEDLSPERSGDALSVALEGDMGYIITDGSQRLCFWVVNYASHRLDLRALSAASEQECDRTALILDGNASDITYYTINGAPRTLSRELQLSYMTLKFDPEQRVYNQEEVAVTLPSVSGAIRVSDVWCDTRFTLSGDRFLRSWGGEQSVESDLIPATAVSAETSATMLEHDAENEQPSDGSALGGSGPVDITFEAVVTDAAVFTEWEIATDAEFENVVDRYNRCDFEYSFREAGTRYVRFNCADASGSCTFTSETYEIYVGESALLCPNAFSPNGDGVNDEWRVSYKSIIDFDCHIYNRWGKELARLTAPSQGWDGKVGGKTVPAGVYFYAIKATGTDGKKYNLSGHINIVGRGAGLHGSSTENPDGPVAPSTPAQ